MYAVYCFKRGGKHRDNPDAARWRALTTEIAAGIRQAHPEMCFEGRHVHAELEAQRVTHLINNRDRQELESLRRT